MHLGVMHPQAGPPMVTGARMVRPQAEAFQAGSCRPMSKEQPITAASLSKLSSKRVNGLQPIVAGLGYCVPRLTLALSGLALLASLAAEWFPLLDIAAPLTGHFLGAFIAASAALALQRAPLTLLSIGLAATVLVHSAIAWSRQNVAERGSAANRSPAVHHPGRIVAINVWHHNRDDARLFDYLASETATWVVLTEIGPERVALIKRLEQYYPHQVSCADVWFCAAALLSKVPFEAAGKINAAKDRPPIVWARFRPPGQAGPVTIVGTHIHRPTRNPWRHRIQLDALAATLKRVEGAVIVAGDFNTSSTAAMLEEFMSASGLGAAGCLLPSWPAWPISLPQFALDHVLVTSELSVSATGLGPYVGSDHLPVWAEIATGHRQAKATCGR